MENGEAFAYKLAVRRTPDHAFYLAYDLTQTLHGQGQQTRALIAAVLVFTLLALCAGLVVGVTGDGAGVRTRAGACGRAA